MNFEVQFLPYSDFDICQSIEVCQNEGMSTSSLTPDSRSAIAFCTPLTREPITTAQAEGISRMLKALADPIRLRLMSMVLSHEGGEACAMCDLTEGFDLAVSTLSHHLKILHDAGLVDREKRGVWVYYKARPEAMEALRAVFSTEPAAAGKPQ